ncbi:hypothetical protein [Desulfitobacterium sp.]|uniref:hypothetical protein n=1 Tax=Desulfitobacterium sp. TaxID=49981 RepID=UPI002B214284|nr:hypothetical protein [Desulfitobacterium sp.]MEA4901901.1 hypothetical protein [Desulfitobacterium sp.]
MKKFVLLVSICILILLEGCSLERSPSIEVNDGKRTITDAIVEFYENTTEPIIIYDQISFEGGTLVLAEKIMDGEHYPELHFVDDNYKVTYLTQGSYCWTLNYTQFKGHSIYFGLAGVESRQCQASLIPAEKVEAIFSNKIVSVLTNKKVVEPIKPLEKDSRKFDNPQGYIMPVEGRDIPEDFVFIFGNREKKSISKMLIERSIDYMPDYLKSNKAEVYNSFAFTYTPMLTPIEWDQGYKEGEICLEGKTDLNGNRNALFLRPAGHMSFLDSFILPQDIKPLYLSDNYRGIASFSIGETVAVKYPFKRALMDCRILKVTKEKVESEPGQDSFDVVNIDEKGQIIMPMDKGYYLFLLRTNENNNIQTYTGMFIIN